MYLGYTISWRELKIDPAKMEAIMKWSMHTNVFEVKIFVGETQYLRNLMASFSIVATPIHAIIVSCKSFQWGEDQQKAFEDLKKETN